MKVFGSVEKDKDNYFINFFPLDVYGDGESLADAGAAVLQVLEVQYGIFPGEVELKATSSEAYLIILDSKLAPSFILKALRNSEGLSKKQVSEKLGMKSRSAYSKYEDKNYGISFEKFSLALKAISSKRVLISI